MINFFWATFFIFYDPLEFLTGACQTPTGQEMSIFHLCAVSLLSMFSIIQPLFLQKTKPLYPHPKYVFGIGIGIGIWAAKN